jgi:hypothetical protein
LVIVVFGVVVRSACGVAKTAHGKMKGKLRLIRKSTRRKHLGKGSVVTAEKRVERSLERSPSGTRGGNSGRLPLHRVCPTIDPFVDDESLSVCTPSSRLDSSQARPSPQRLERRRFALADAGQRAGCAIEEEGKEEVVRSFSSSSSRDSSAVDELPKRKFTVTDVECSITDGGVNGERAMRRGLARRGAQDAGECEEKGAEEEEEDEESVSDKQDGDYEDESSSESRKGRRGSEGGGGCAVSVLDRLIDQQSSMLGARNDPSVWDVYHRRAMVVSAARRRGSRGSMRWEDGDSESSESESETTALSRWSRYLKTLPKDFFSSAEARMQAATSHGETGSELAGEQVRAGRQQHVEEVEEEESMHGAGRRRCTPYAGLILQHTPVNCPDILYCYEQCYEMKIRRGGRREGYSQFKAVAGQLARFAVAVEVASAPSFAEAGGLFVLVRSSRLIRAFIGGFQQHAQASTVYSKATLLGGLCRMAKQHFGKVAAAGEIASIVSHIEETLNLLGGFRRVEKATSRRQTAILRDQEQRECFIGPKDWYWLQDRIEEDMRRVWSGIRGLENQFGSDAHRYLDENHNLVRKYSLLLLVFLILTGGGQRPQVYCSLQYPTEAVLRGWEEESSNGDGGPVKLYPALEKTPRGTFSPGILYPEISASFFATYCNAIRPSVMRGSGKMASDAASSGRTFLVHTETGLPLSGENLRNTLRYYVGGLDRLSADLSRMTVMTVRASFASMMFRSFRKGAFANQSFDGFLCELAETMNTSTEMLRSTYIAANGKEFDEAASAFLRASRGE